LAKGKNPDRKCRAHEALKRSEGNSSRVQVTLNKNPGPTGRMLYE